MRLPSADQAGCRASLYSSVMRRATPPAEGRSQSPPCRSIASWRPSGEAATDIDVPSVTVTSTRVGGMRRAVIGAGAEWEGRCSGLSSRRGGLFGGACSDATASGSGGSVPRIHLPPLVPTAAPLHVIHTHRALRTRPEGPSFIPCSTSDRRDATQRPTPRRDPPPPPACRTRRMPRDHRDASRVDPHRVHAPGRR